MSIDATIVVESELEEHLHHLGSEGAMVCPVVQPGVELKGELTLALLKGKTAKLDGLELKARSYAMFQEDVHTQVAELKSTPINTQLDGSRSYDLTEEIKVPFTVPADAFMPIETFSGEKMFVGNDIQLTTTGGMFGMGALDVSCHLVMQIPGDKPPPSEKAWMTVADCGGTIKLEMKAGPVVEFDGTLNANLIVNSTEPLEWIELLLLQSDGKSAPKTFRKQTLYKRAAGKDPAEVDDFEKEITMPTSSAYDTMKLYPSLPLTPNTESLPIKVQHSVQLRVKPVGGKEAWNSLDVRMKRTKVAGSKKGSLTPKIAPYVPIFGPCFKLFAVLALLLAALVGGFSVAMKNDPEGTLDTLVKYNVPFAEDIRADYLESIKEPPPPPPQMPQPPLPPPPPPMTPEAALERLQTLEVYKNLGMDKDEKLREEWVEKLVANPYLLSMLETDSTGASAEAAAKYAQMGAGWASMAQGYKNMM